MSTVFITCEDSRLDYSGALAFGGKAVAVFQQGQTFLSPAQDLEKARTVLFNMEEGDYLALSGDPVRIAICAIAAAEVVNNIKFLRWNRHTMTYVPVEVPIE